MLGSMVFNYLSKLPDCEVEVVDHRWPNSDFKKYLCDFRGDVVVNCIGAIPQRTSNFDVNFELPIWLDKTLDCPIVHPSTDCEIDEDDYGTSKRRAMEYLNKHGRKTWAIKTSIIGPELSTSYSLLEWFLHTTTPEVVGYTHHMWNGITTLQWAKICWELVNNFDRFSTITIPYSECISKFDLLNIIKEVYGKDVTIIGSDVVQKDKCLEGTLPTPNITQQLRELLRFCNYESSFTY